MGIRRPGLREMLRSAQDGPLDRKRFGPARAMIQCRERDRSWRTIGWVHGNAVMGTAWPHDSPHDLRSNYEVLVLCEDCNISTMLDLAALRAQLRKPHAGVLRLDVRDIARLLD